MATAEQTYTSGELKVEWDDLKRTREYTVDTADEAAATAACPAKGSIVDGLYVVDTAAKRVGENRCTVMVELAAKRPASGGEPVQREVGGSIMTFDTAATTDHIIRAFSQTKYGGANDADVGNLIGVTDDDILGTDIYVPTFTRVETHFFAPAAITDAYVDTLYRLTATINDGVWRIFGAREALFLGAQGRPESTDRYEVTYTFLGSPTKVLTIDINGTPTAVTKPGWDYLWFRVKKAVAAKQPTYTVRAAYVSRVLEEATFTDLGIGS